MSPLSPRARAASLPHLCCVLLLSLILGLGSRATAQLGSAGESMGAEAVSVAARLSGQAAAGGRGELIVSLSIQPPFHINANPASESFLIPTQVLVDKAPGVQAGQPVYPGAEQKKFAFYSKLLKVYQGKAEVRVPLTFASSYSGAPLAGSLKYQACNDQSCLAPVTVKWKASGAGTSGAPLGAIASKADAAGGAEADAVSLRDRFGVKGLPTLVFVDASGKERADLRAGEELSRASMERKLEAVRSGADLGVQRGGALDWMGRLSGAPLWLQLVLVFVGGLLLNLTPCVYPMIPITVGYFGLQSEGRAGKTFGLALLYVLGLALVYSTLGVFAALTGNLFGSAMQSPWLLGFMALVLGGLGLSMAGLFTLNPPRWAMSRAGAKKGAWGALGMGALLGVVAAPCVGPVVAALLSVVAATGNAALGFALFFTLSLGLGLPYLLLGTFSGSAKSLPRAGAWMEKSKKIFAIPLVLAGLYYGYLAFKSVPRGPSSTSLVSRVDGANGAWPRATLVALEQAKSQGRPVVLDFRADWCLPCLKMEDEIFKRPSTHQAAQKSGVLLLQVDLTRAAE